MYVVLYYLFHGLACQNYYRTFSLIDDFAKKRTKINYTTKTKTKTKTKRVTLDNNGHKVYQGFLIMLYTFYRKVSLIRL